MLARGFTVSAAGEGEILTLEPLIDAIRGALESTGWELSGLQKTTSQEFAGRWEGESTRSAYLFFHPSPGPEWATLDVFLDETSRGLGGNLALVVDGRSLADLGDVARSLTSLAQLAGTRLPQHYRTPVTLRFRLEAPDREAGTAESEIRLKVLIPRSCIASGASAVSDMAVSAADAMRALLHDSRLMPFVDTR